MSNRNISQIAVSFEKFIHQLRNQFKNVNVSKWVNGRPVLINGDVWCPMCEQWHINNSLCQQSY